MRVEVTPGVRAVNGVLVLNASYEPLNIVSVQRAIVLLLKEKAELVEAARAKIRAERLHMDVPLVIRLVTYVPIPRRLPLPLSRRTVWRVICTCANTAASRRVAPNSRLTMCCRVRAVARPRGKMS